MGKSKNRSIAIDWIIANYHNFNDTGEPLPYKNPQSELEKLPDEILQKMIEPLIQRAKELKLTDILHPRQG
jgi:hypothetical protein